MAGLLDEFLILFKPTVQGTGFQVLNKQIKHTYDNLFSVKGLLRTFVGYDLYSGLKQFIGGMVDATREMGAMRSRFFAITGDEAKSNQQLQWAFDLAKRTAMPMKSLADSYSIFYGATQKGLGDAGAQQVFQDWTEVSRVLHMSEYQFERVTYALREMASKGVVYSQDLRMQIGTHVPNAIGIAQKAVNELGITGTDWFDKFQKQSKGNQKMINQFLLLFSKFAKEQFADPKALEKSLLQPDAQMVMLKNHWDELRYAIADAGFSEDLAKALMKINDFLDKIIKKSDKFYKLLKDIAQILLLITGMKILGRLGIFAKNFVKVFKNFGRIKSGTKIASLIFGRGLGARFIWLSKTFRIASKNIAWLGKKFVSGKAKLLVFKLLVSQIGKLGLKSVIAFIPYIGQIIFALWTVYDVCKLVFDLIDVAFPNISMWIKELGSEIKDFILHPFISIKNYIQDWFGGFPEIKKPNFALFDESGKANLNNLLKPRKSTDLTSPVVYIQPNITNNNTVNANSSSVNDIGNTVDNIARKNNMSLIDIMRKGIGDSKNKNK